MKMIDILGGLKIHISEEENSIVEACKKEKIYASALNERNNELARRMTSRGVLNRKKDDNGIFYTFNGLDDIWRF